MGVTEGKRMSEILNQSSKPAGVRPAAAKPKKLSGGAMLSIVLMFAIIAACAAVYFNLGGARQALVSALGMTTVEAAAEKSLQTEAAAQAELDEQAEEMEREQSELQEKKDELDARENELNHREQELAARETAVSETEAGAAQEEQAETELAAAAQIFAQMEPKSAAKAIAGMETTEDMVKILMSMSSDHAALIMEEMDSGLVSEILSAMLQ